MSLFEFTFALSAVILGLALTQIASDVHKLLLAGRRVTWAAEPVLLTLIVLLVIVAVWLGQWFDRAEASVSVGWILLTVVKLLILYIAAASCLPEVDNDQAPVDMFAYYDRTRRLSFGALIVSYALFEVADVINGDLPARITLWVLTEWLLYPVLYLSLIIVRARWFNILALLFGLLFYANFMLRVRLDGG